MLDQRFKYQRHSGGSWAATVGNFIKADRMKDVPAPKVSDS